MRFARSFSAVFVLFVGAFALARAEEPLPRERDSGPESFGLRRALDVRGRLLTAGGAQPHALGMTAHDPLRDAVAAELRALGASVETQVAWECSEHNTCARVQNLVARMPASQGVQQNGVVLLAAHYDSVPAGPGASDDLGGVAAVLELARAAGQAQGLARGVAVLVSDGEEAGLLGARAFARAHPLAGEVRAVVNLEARGTSGLAMLFETGRDDASIASFIARAPRPATSSALVAVYRAMPNDTDYSVFRDRGIPGANFAFIGGGTRYHTSLDDAAHASSGSLLQLGESALPVLLGFARETRHTAGGAHWFDVAGLFVVRWPAGLTRPLAYACLALWISAVLLARRRRVLPSYASVARGLGAHGAVLLGSLALAWAFGAAQRVLGNHPAPYTANAGLGAVQCAHFVTLLGFGVVSLRAARRARAFGLHLAAWAAPVALAVLLAHVAPGAAVLVLAPALAAVISTLFSLLFVRSSRSLAVALSVAPGSALLAVTLAPALRLLPEVLGTLLVPAFAALPSVLFATLTPLFARRESRVGALLALALVPVAVFVAALAGPYTKDSPQRCSLIASHDADRHRTRYLVDTSLGPFSFGGLPRALREAFPALERTYERPYPWSYQPAWSVEAPEFEAPPPALEVSRTERNGGVRTITGTLRSPRGAPWVSLWFEPASYNALRSVRIEGVSVPLARDVRGSVPLRVLTVPSEGVAIEVSADERAPLRGVLIDEAPGFTAPDADAWRRARDVLAAPSQQGDLTAVHRWVEL